MRYVHKSLCIAPGINLLDALIFLECLLCVWCCSGYWGQMSTYPHGAIYSLRVCGRYFINCNFFFFCFCFLGPHLSHMEVPRLGVKSEPKLPAYTIATATWDPSRVFSLHHSSWQCRILNWVRPGIKPVSSWIPVRFVNHWAMKGTPNCNFLLVLLKAYFTWVIILSIYVFFLRRGSLQLKKKNLQKYISHNFFLSLQKSVVKESR